MNTYVEIKTYGPSVPKSMRRHVLRALKWVNPVDLVGLDLIKLIYEVDPSSLNETLRQGHDQGQAINGMYFRKRSDRPAQIHLYSKDLYLGIPLKLKRWPIVTYCIARTLFHEIGHHVIAEKGYIYLPTEKYKGEGYDEFKEEMADRYAFDLLSKMTNHPYYKLGKSMTRWLANEHYAQGIYYWKLEQYSKAAEKWYFTWHLNPAHEYAAHWYWRAREMSENV